MKEDFSADQFLDGCYTEIDTFLNNIFESGGHSYITLNDLDPNMIAIIKQILDGHKLVEAAVPTSKTSQLYLTPLGLQVLEKGIRWYLAEDRRLKDRAESIQELTHKNLTWESLPKKYWLVIAVFNAAVAGIVSLIVYFLTEKS